MSTEEQTIKINITILGESSVGKTAILVKYTENNFDIEHISTMGIDSRSKDIFIDGHKVSLRIWDTAGQERYRTIAPRMYKSSQGIILVYSITDKETFDKITEWVTTIRKDTQKPMILLGNKSDLENKRKVQKEEGQNLAKQLGLKFYETSALNGANLNEVFNELSKTVLASFEEDKKKGIVHNECIHLEEIKKKKGCCK